MSVCILSIQADKNSELLSMSSASLLPEGGKRSIFYCRLLYPLHGQHDTYMERKQDYLETIPTGSFVTGDRLFYTSGTRC